MRVVCLVALLCAAASCASYSSGIARQLSIYSEISHCEQQQIAAWSCDIFTSQVLGQDAIPFENPERKTAGFAAYNPSLNAIVIAFRGSENIDNWITNLDFIRTAYDGCSGCSVHKGFLKAYDDISVKVRAGYSSLKSLYPSAQLIVTGHSLGGALAVLCAMDLKAQVNLVYTFGQPRVGNDAFAAYYNAQLPDTFRLINYADTVVHSPPKWMGFLHHGVEVWYSPRGMAAYYICQSEASSCANSVSTLAFSTSDHALTNYMSVQVVNLSSLLQRISDFFSYYANLLYSNLLVLGLSDQQIEELEVQKLQESLNIVFPPLERSELRPNLAIEE